MGQGKRALLVLVTLVVFAQGGGGGVDAAHPMPNGSSISSTGGWAEEETTGGAGPEGSWADALGLLGLPNGDDDRQQHQHQHQHGQGYLIVPLLHSGLARRLQLLASAYQAAEESNRTLVAAWYPSPHCPAPLTSLLTPQSIHDAAGILLYRGSVDVLVSLLPLYTTGDPQRRRPVALEHLLGPAVVTVSHAVLASASLLQERRHLPVAILDPTSGGFFKLSHVPCSEFYDRLSTFLSHTLTPLPSIQARAQAVIHRLRLPPVSIDTDSMEEEEEGGGEKPRMLLIGVHVRLDDPAFDSPLVLNLLPTTSTTPSRPHHGGDGDGEHGPTGHARKEVEEEQAAPQYLGWNESAPLESYADAMAWLVLTTEEEGISNSSTGGGNKRIRYYVASNKEQAKVQVGELANQRLQRLDGGGRRMEVLTWEDMDMEEEEEGMQTATTTYDRSVLQGVQHALVELLVLSACDGVMHASESSYGKVAAYRSKAPSLVLFKHLRLLGPVSEEEGGKEGGTWCNTLEFMADWVMQQQQAPGQDQDGPSSWYEIGLAAAADGRGHEDDEDSSKEGEERSKSSRRWSFWAGGPRQQREGQEGERQHGEVEDHQHGGVSPLLVWQLQQSRAQHAVQG